MKNLFLVKISKSVGNSLICYTVNERISRQNRKNLFTRVNNKMNVHAVSLCMNTDGMALIVIESCEESNAEEPGGQAVRLEYKRRRRSSRKNENTPAEDGGVFSPGLNRTHNDVCIKKKKKQQPKGEQVSG